MRTILSTTAASSACIVSQNKKDARQRAADSTHVRQGELTPYIFYLGSLYVQADAPYRMQPQDIGRWQVRNSAGQMVPLSAFTGLRWETAPPQLVRFNGALAMDMQAGVQDGQSSGSAMKEVENIMAQLPAGFGYSESK